MMDLSCLNTIITDNLAVHIDLTNLNSWNLNTGFTSISLTKWNKAISDNIFLYDFGLTAFDNGRIDQMTDTLNILPLDNKLTLYRVGYNNATGGTFYDGYGITGVTASALTSTHIVISGTGVTITTGTTFYGPFTGNFFDLDGGYLQGFFKLKKYNYELLPPRYGSGITIETIIKLTADSFNDGYFFFMGARAEDKYVPSFSGECIQYTATTSASTANGGTRVTNTVMFSGVTTSEDHFLTNYYDTEVMLAGTSNGDLFVNEPVASDDRGRNGNTIGFFISTDKRIGYTRINLSGVTESNISTKQLTSTGWTMIDIVFQPYEIITDRKTLDCSESRKGDFLVYVNGRKFWKIEDFDEYYFKGFKTEREKQLGVPYNVSWGGGTFGLKHSYHWDLKKYIIFDENSDVSFASGFTFTTDPFWNDPFCVVPPLPDNISGTTITGDSTTFLLPDMCGTGTTANIVLEIFNTSNVSGTTTLPQYNILYTTELELISNRDYIFSTNVYEENIFEPYHDGIIGMFFSGETEITTVEKKEFDILYDSGYTWTPIHTIIRTKNNTGKSKVIVGLYIKSDVALVPNFKLYFDKFIYRGADILSQDHTKDFELVEQLYDNSFIGGIQKLRIYDTVLNSQEILHNAIIEFKNSAYESVISRGGRLIYK